MSSRSFIWLDNDRPRFLSRCWLACLHIDNFTGLMVFVFSLVSLLFGGGGVGGTCLFVAFFVAFFRFRRRRSCRLLSISERGDAVLRRSSRRVAFKTQPAMFLAYTSRASSHVCPSGLACLLCTSLTLLAAAFYQVCGTFIWLRIHIQAMVRFCLAHAQEIWQGGGRAGGSFQSTATCRRHFHGRWE